jgi:hypothetical protein
MTCPVCRLEFSIAAWTLVALQKRGDSFYCPAGHKLLLSTLSKPMKGQTIEDAIAEVENNLKGEENGQ